MAAVRRTWPVLGVIGSRSAPPGLLGTAGWQGGDTAPPGVLSRPNENHVHGGRVVLTSKVVRPEPRAGPPGVTPDLITQLSFTPQGRPQIVDNYVWAVHKMHGDTHILWKG